MNKRNMLLWISVLGGPFVWLSSFEARFALVPWACTFDSKLALFGVAVAALIICAACGTIGWREWKVLGENEPSSDAGPLSRGTFMAIGGIVLSAACFLIVIAQMIPELMLGACQ
ncbi:MAG: hypothetical protein JO319_17510 [Acidobacteriaceae bacterium]|nr:hypothetical protein [Acidobacteriaceae bacterium]